VLNPRFRTTVGIAGGNDWLAICHQEAHSLPVARKFKAGQRLAD
jgi:hypothetical protein